MDAVRDCAAGRGDLYLVPGLLHSQSADTLMGLKDVVRMLEADRRQRRAMLLHNIAVIAFLIVASLTAVLLLRLL